MGTTQAQVRSNKVVLISTLYSEGPFRNDSGRATNDLLEAAKARGCTLETGAGLRKVLSELPIEFKIRGKRTYLIELKEVPDEFALEVEAFLKAPSKEPEPDPIVHTVSAPVVPEVTDEDITRLGKAILDEVFTIYLRPRKEESNVQRLREALDQREAYAKRLKETEVTIEHLGKMNNSQLVRIRNLEAELAQLRSNLAVTLNGHKVAISSEVRKELSRIMQAKPSRHFNVDQDG